MLPPVYLSLLSLFCVPLVLGQVALPDTPWTPPNASSGAVPSHSDSTPNPQWANLLGDLLYFYDCQRSGELPSSNRVPWRNTSLADDGKDAGVDLSGGYYDAGDYVKFTFPLSFTLMSVCWGALDFGKGYDNANQTAYLDSMLRWGLDWLIKAHPSSHTLFVQVGDANPNDAYWGGDLNIPTNRPAYQINDTSPGTDAAAQASAAFSACAALYGNSSFGYNPTTSALSPTRASLQNASYAGTLLDHAQDLYQFAMNASGGQTLYQKSVPTLAQAYGSSSFQDELVVATMFLGLATNSSQMVDQAQSLYQQFSLGGQNGVFNWDSKAPGLAVLGTQLALSNFGGNTSGWQQEAERYFDTIVNHKGPGTLVGGGLLWYNGDSDSASLNPALNAAMLMSRYATLASTPQKSISYSAFAATQLDYALGKNPMDAPYVVGVNPNAPTNPHSALASGGNDIAHINTAPEQEAYVLYGGVVGGPDRRGRFFNIRSDWPETEAALDYGAPMLTLSALRVLNDSSDPFYTSLTPGSYASKQPAGHPCDAVFSCAPHLPTVGKIVIGAVVGGVGLIIVGLGAWFVLSLWRSPDKGLSA